MKKSHYCFWRLESAKRSWKQAPSLIPIYSSFAELHTAISWEMYKPKPVPEASVVKKVQTIE